MMMLCIVGQVAKRTKHKMTNGLIFSRFFFFFKCIAAFSLQGLQLQENENTVNQRHQNSFGCFKSALNEISLIFLHYFTNLLYKLTSVSKSCLQNKKCILGYLSFYLDSSLVDGVVCFSYYILYMSAMIRQKVNKKQHINQ